MSPVLPKFSSCTESRAPSRAALLSTWWVRTSREPSSTSITMRTSKGSSRASSIIMAPRSRVLIRLIAHLRVRSDVDGAKGEEEELVRRRHRDFCVGGGNSVDDVRSRSHVDSPADVQARQIRRYVRLHLGS